MKASEQRSYARYDNSLSDSYSIFIIKKKKKLYVKQENGAMQSRIQWIAANSMIKWKTNSKPDYKIFRTNRNLVAYYIGINQIMLDKHGNGPQKAFLFRKLYTACLYVYNIELSFHFVIEFAGEQQNVIWHLG